MGSIRITGLPEAEPEAEPWPVDDHTIRLDEMFARQLDTEFASGVRGLLHDPETGIAAQSGEVALEAIAGAMPALADLKERTLAQTIGPRQRSLLEPMLDTRLDWAAGTIGRLAQRATEEVDDASVAGRLAGLAQDAATAWQDPAYLRRLGRTAVNELRYQGERCGWDPSETDTRVRAGLSSLYAGAVEAAIGQDDLDGAAALYEHARVVIEPDRQAVLDHRFERARETALYRDIDRKLADLPLDPAGPPALEAFEQRAAQLTPDDASDAVRAGLARVADHAHRYAERQWHRRQAAAGLAALDWIQKNPDVSIVALPAEVRDWLAPDQWQGLEALAIEGRLKADGDLFERLDRQMVHDPDAFAAVDLDRHRLSLADLDYSRFAAAQKAIAEGRIDPDLARYDRLRLGLDRALEGLGVDPDGHAAAKSRADARGQLKSFEIIEGRLPNAKDIDDIARHAIEGVTPERTVSGAGDSASTDGQSMQPDTWSVDEFGPASMPPGPVRPARQDAVSTEEGEPPPFGGDPNIVLVGGGGNASRRGGGGRPLTPIEEMRAANFQSTLNALRELEPNNRELSYIAPRGWVPSDRDVARAQEELARARQRAATPGAPTESRPGRDHNNPPGLVESERTSILPPPGQAPPTTLRGSPSTPPVPDTAHPASAAEQAAVEKRMADYNTFRGHLQELDPGNPLLKSEPVPGAAPDQSMVESYEREVTKVVKAKIEVTLKDLMSRGAVEHRSEVRTISDSTNLRTVFDELRVGGKRVFTARGEYREGGIGELYALPGSEGIRVGFRMATDVRKGTPKSIPTLEFIFPGEAKPIKFHYNTER